MADSLPSARRRGFPAAASRKAAASTRDLPAFSQTQRFFVIGINLRAIALANAPLAAQTQRAFAAFGTNRSHACPHIRHELSGRIFQPVPAPDHQPQRPENITGASKPCGHRYLGQPPPPSLSSSCKAGTAQSRLRQATSDAPAGGGPQPLALASADLWAPAPGHRERIMAVADAHLAFAAQAGSFSSSSFQPPPERMMLTGVEFDLPLHFRSSYIERPPFLRFGAGWVTPAGRNTRLQSTQQKGCRTSGWRRSRRMITAAHGFARADTVPSCRVSRAGSRSGGGKVVSPLAAPAACKGPGRRQHRGSSGAKVSDRHQPSLPGLARLPEAVTLAKRLSRSPFQRQRQISFSPPETRRRRCGRQTPSGALADDEASMSRCRYLS